MWSSLSPGSSFLHPPDRLGLLPCLNYSKCSLGRATRSRKQTEILQQRHCGYKIKNQIFQTTAAVSETGSLSAPRDIISFFLVSGADFSPLSGTRTCCTFSVLWLFSPRIAVTPSFRNLLRQSVCCLFEYGLKPMHARVKWWWDQVSCLIFLLFLLLF